VWPRVALALLLVGPGPRAWSAPAAPVLPTLFLTTNEERLAYDDTGGDGPLVLAVPGMGDVRQSYRFLTPFLKDAGYRVVTVDLRGFGGSDAGWSDYSARAVAGDLLRLETRLGQSRAILIGNSFAAGAALWAAHDAPGRVRAAVLLAPVVRDSSVPTPWYMRIVVRMMFASPWRVQFWLRYWDSLFPARQPPDQAAYRAALAHNLRQPGRMAALEVMALLSKAPTARMLPQVKAPALLVMGTEDPDFDDPTAEAKWLSGQIGARLEVVPGAGHYPHVEMPEQVGPVVVDFLRKLSP
jgi:pimeloyl-ACP methyl ester carboxylesterase